MLISHIKKFIFFKSVKTASTSVFNFLLPYCLPKNIIIQDFNILSKDYFGYWPTGIVGLKKPIKSKTKDIVAKIYKDDIKKFKYEFEKF